MWFKFTSPACWIEPNRTDTKQLAAGILARTVRKPTHNRSVEISLLTNGNLMNAVSVALTKALKAERRLPFCFL